MLETGCDGFSKKAANSSSIASVSPTDEKEPATGEAAEAANAGERAGAADAANGVGTGDASNAADAADATGTTSAGGAAAAADASNAAESATVRDAAAAGDAAQPPSAARIPEAMAPAPERPGSMPSFASSDRFACAMPTTSRASSPPSPSGISACRRRPISSTRPHDRASTSSFSEMILSASRAMRRSAMLPNMVDPLERCGYFRISIAHARTRGPVPGRSRPPPAGRAHAARLAPTGGRAAPCPP